jgi:hypothetical protein
MADFFKGLAGGFGTGLQFGQAMQARQERERLREAMGLTPQAMEQRQATPEELARAQAETQGRAAQDATDFGLTPQEQAMYAPQMPVEGQRIGATQYGLGGQTFNRMPTQQEIESARYAAAANVLAERDPVAAARMRQEQVRMQRENELFPLQKQQLETQVESGKIGLKKSGFELTAAERADADAKRMVDFNAWRSQNPQADFATMTAKAQELGMGVDQQFKIASNLTGIKEQAFKAAQQRIQELVQDQGLDGLLKAHKESKDLDPNSHFEVIRGKGGKVSLNRVNTATGEVIQPNVFSGSEAETTAYLNKAAMNPATIIDFTMTLEKNKLGMDKDRAAIRASDATVRYRDQQGKALDAAKGLTQKQEDYQRALDGVFEGYQSAMALGPQGRQAAAIYAREYDQLRANVPKGLRAPPSIASMNEAQRAEKPEKPVKVEDAGVQYKVGGKLMQTDGRGGLISAKGILPDDRPTVLKTVGISDNNASRLMWSDDGETVMFNNEEFDIRDKRDVEKLNRMLKDYDVMNRTIAEEARLRANPTSPSGFQGARTTGIGPASTYGVAPGAQSIYGR